MNTPAARSAEVAEVDPADAPAGVADGVVDAAGRPRVTLVGIRGTVDLAGAPALRGELERLLRTRHRVVADVSRAELAHSGAVHLFADALQAAGGWPEAGLLLASPDATLASVLRSSHVADSVPVHPDVATALAHAEDRPALVRDCWHFGVDPRAPREARANVRRVCAAWDIADEVCELAEIVVTELVTNAVEHASSRSLVDVRRRSGRFRLDVRDWDTTVLPEVALPSPMSARGRGLAMVAALSTEWGVHPHPDGKSVWSELSA